MRCYVYVRSNVTATLSVPRFEKCHKFDTVMTEQLSGVTVVIIIACGVLTVILFFLFAKRQIMRFALRSRRGPHVPIGHGARKVSKVHVISLSYCKR